MLLLLLLVTIFSGCTMPRLSFWKTTPKEPVPAKIAFSSQEHTLARTAAKKIREEQAKTELARIPKSRRDLAYKHPRIPMIIIWVNEQSTSTVDVDPDGSVIPSRYMITQKGKRKKTTNTLTIRLEKGQSPGINKKLKNRRLALAKHINLPIIAIWATSDLKHIVDVDFVDGVAASRRKHIVGKGFIELTANLKPLRIAKKQTYVPLLTRPANRRTSQNLRQNPINYNQNYKNNQHTYISPENAY